MAPIPQPFEVKIADPPQLEPSAPNWSGAIGQLRTVAQWVIGGVVATAAGVFAGGSLSNVGSMSFPEDAGRLSIAFAGVAVGFIAMAAIMYFGLSVLAPTGHSLDELAVARGVDKAARKRLLELHRIDEKRESLVDLLALPESDPRAQECLPLLYIAAPFCVVRARFDRLMRWMAICVPAAIIGFGFFAWGANPPDKPSAPEHGIVLKVIY